YSIKGANPILKGVFSATYMLQWDVPAAIRRYHLRTKKERDLSVRVLGSPPAYSETEAQGIIERIWSLEPALPYPYEPSTPSWWVGNTQVTVADKHEWADISDMFRRYYECKGQLPVELEKEVLQIEEQTASPPERIRL